MQATDFLTIQRNYVVYMMTLGAVFVDVFEKVFVSGEYPLLTLGSPKSSMGIPDFLSVA